MGTIFSAFLHPMIHPLPSEGLTAEANSLLAFAEWKQPALVGEWHDAHDAHDAQINGKPREVAAVGFIWQCWRCERQVLAKQRRTCGNPALFGGGHRLADLTVH